MNDGSTQINKAELLAAIQHDCVALFAFFLAEELTLEVPDFHISIWDELLEMIEQSNQEGAIIALQKLFAVPRGFAKSTLAKLAAVLFLMYSPMRFVMYASKTVGHGKNAIRDILMWLGSDQYRELHGQLYTYKSNEGEALWIIDLPIRDAYTNEVKWKRCIFKAMGANSHVRGTNIMNMRPQIIIVDDIEDNDNTTPDLQPKLDEWFMGAFWKSFDASHRVVIFIGNMIRETTLLARLAKDPEWKPTVFGAIVRDIETGQIRSLWEDKFPLAGLLKEYMQFRKLGTGHIWEAEMMNLTQDEIFKADMTEAVRPPHPNPEDLEAGMLVLDPSFGQNMWNDDTAISVHARIKGLGIPCVVDAFKGRITEETMFDKMMELSYYWGIKTWIIEADVAQRILIPYFKLLMLDRKIRSNLFQLLPITSSRTNKQARIMTMRSAVGAGTYAIDESLDTVLEGFMTYNPNQRHEDLLDSVSFGLIAWTTYETVIIESGIEIQLFRVAQNHYGESNSDYVSAVDICSF